MRIDLAIARGRCRRAVCTLAFGLLALVASGCELSQSAQSQVTVSISADGVDAPSCPAVRQHRLRGAHELPASCPGSLDRSQPPFYAVLRDGDVVKLTRVEESFRTETTTLPFERQILRNESLPEGQQRLVQSGVNGEQELTYRAIVEDGVQVSETVVKSVVLKEPVPEIDHGGSSDIVSTIVDSGPTRVPGRRQCLDDGHIDRQPKRPGEHRRP